MKPSQRKCLFGCLKKKIKNEIKIAQLSGYISEVSGYHSGEASLQGTLIGLAQDFVGASNINLLQPIGQFGTRLQGGKDAASPRYIFTQLSEITHNIFDERDSPLLKYLDDDGFPIEPKHYAPIIPMVLVNGANGIGTGFSTQIPSYNPIDIVDNIGRLLDDQEVVEMHPWYRGFTGAITQNGTTFVTHGKYEILGDIVTVTELPIGRWTDDYKEFLENSMVDGADKNAKRASKLNIVSFENHSTEAEIKFQIKFPRDHLSKIAGDSEKLETDLRLTSNIGTTNMHLYSPESVIRKYDSAEDILKSYFGVRLSMYEDRRQYLLATLREELSVLENKSRFVSEIMNDDLTVYRKSKSELDDLLSDRNFKRTASDESVASGFNYLTSMQISSFTKEKIESLQSQIASITRDIEKLEHSTDKSMWIDDLQAFRSVYDKHSLATQVASSEASQPKSNSVIAKKKRKTYHRSG